MRIAATIMDQVHIEWHGEPAGRCTTISQDIRRSWCEILHALTEVFHADGSLVMRLLGSDTWEVSAWAPHRPVTSLADHHPGDDLIALCSEVVRSHSIINTCRKISRPGHDERPTGAVVSLLGLPILWPTQAPFGVLCAYRKGNHPFPGKAVTIARYASRLVATDLHILFLADRLERQQRLLERLLNEKEQFTAVAAHDMKNALNVFLGCCRHLLPSADGLDERNRSYLDLAQQSASTLIHLMDELMDIARIESFPRTSPPSECDLVGSLGEAIRYHQHIADERGIVIHFCAPPCTVTVSMEAAMLGSVINNLLSNAVKYSPGGSDVVISVETTGPEVLVRVRDFGPGIPEAEQTSLFRPFYRTSAQPFSGETGTGLGLFIARRVVEEHGGRIWVESAPGTGTTFCFSLPILRGNTAPCASH